MTNEYFKIEWIIELISEQKPERTDLIQQLNRIGKRTWERQAYIYFVSGFEPNQDGSEWQFEESIVLHHESGGTIVLDVLKDGRIGGIEFLSQITD